MKAITPSPATQISVTQKQLAKQLDKFDDKKHFLKLDDKKGVVAVSKTGLSGFCNRVLKRFCPKQFNVQSVAVRIMSKDPSLSALKSNAGFKKFRDKCQSKQTSSKSHRVAHSVLSLESENGKINLKNTFEMAMKLHFPGSRLDCVDYESKNLQSPTKTKTQAVLNAIKGRLSDEKNLRGSLKTEKAVQIILDTVEYAAKVDSLSISTEKLREDIFHEYNLVFSTY
jgi:hypothetical protein